MSELKLMLSMQLPSSEPKPEHCSAPSIEEKVREACELVESGYNSDVEWIMLGRLFESLKKRKQTPRILNLINMIRPVLSKYGYHGVSNRTET